MKVLLLSILWFVAAAACNVGPAHAQAVETNGEPRTQPEYIAKLRWDPGHRGREIDLGQFRRTFNDDFRQMDVVADNREPGPGAVWFSPGHPSFRKNSPLRTDGPFGLLEDGLRMREERVGDRCLGACLTTVNAQGRGFAQRYGYFEMTVRWDYQVPYDGLWGAVWLKSQKDFLTKGTTTRTEIDIAEFYGDDAYHVSLHLWAAAKPQPGATITKSIHISGAAQKLAPDLFKALKVGGVVQGFHHYGVELTPRYVIAYFDRKEVGRFPMVDEWKTPVYLLMDMDPSRVKPRTALPMDQVVRNVSAYLPIEPYAE